MPVLIYSFSNNNQAFILAMKTALESSLLLTAGLHVFLITRLGRWLMHVAFPNSRHLSTDECVERHLHNYLKDY